MAHVIRDAVDVYLFGGVDDVERERLLAETFGALPALAERVPSREEWDRTLGAGS